MTSLVTKTSRIPKNNRPTPKLDTSIACVRNLYEIQAGVNVVLHDEHGQMAVRFPYAVIQHPDEYAGIILEVQHELLVFLHHLTKHRHPYTKASKYQILTRKS